MKKIVYIFSMFFLCTLISCSSTTADNNPGNSAESKDYAIENILSRKSVRKYSDKEIEQEKIDIILKCAMAAPSAMNKQPWEILVINDKEKLEKIAEILPNASYSKNSQVTIIVCGDKNVSEKFWEQDCSAVSENILLAAESLGLGAVWCAVYPFDEKVEAVKNLFELPENIVPLNVIPMGYPETNEDAKEKYDSKKIHINGWL
ncbi:MAG: nitroreductase family protein [Elusimicrobia bacterium]|jgi:nitroreductase|nr:nitroreductase family protein [Elusimicrobiota bacterium]